MIVEDEEMGERWNVERPIAGKRLPYKLTSRGSCAPIAIGSELPKPDPISHHRPYAVALSSIIGPHHRPTFHHTELRLHSISF